MSGALRIRVRGPQGAAVITINGGATWGELKREIAEKTGVADFDLKYGYPPQPFNTVSIDAAVKLIDLPQNLNNEQFIVTPREGMQAKLSDPLAGPSAPSQRSANVTAAKTASTNTEQPLRLSRQPKPNVDSDPPEIPVPELDGIMVLRVMPDDNSCLFRALSAAVLGASLDGMTELRSLVAQTIQAQPETYSEGILEKKPEEYCRWIQREDSWGGGIEMSILSQQFDIEICSINVQDLRIDKFNEGRPTRCILVYSGIHYDVCAVSPLGIGGAALEVDKKIFNVLHLDGEELDGGALQAAVELCKVLKARHYYTDTAGFALKCLDCNQSGSGQSWAVQHAKATGHGNFGENN